jgi:hypothetical protein
MSNCDTSQKALRILDCMGASVADLKNVISAAVSAEKDVETSEPTDSYKSRVDRVHARLKAGSGCNNDAEKRFPSEMWFRDCVLPMVRDEARACRTIAKKYGADKTVNAINKRLDSR